MTFVLAALVAACNPPVDTTGKAGTRLSTTGAADGGADPDGGAMGFDGTGGPDSDGDGVPDANDCDPTDSNVGQRVIEDDLSTAKGLVKTAPGFDPMAWNHSFGAFQQVILRDQNEAAFVDAQGLGELTVAIRAASTEIGTFSPTLRQILVVVGANADGRNFSGYGCGVEVIDGTNQYKASIVRLSGSAYSNEGYSVASDAIKRSDRDPLQLNEEFGINVRVQGGNITCTIDQTNHSTTIAALNVGTVQGSVGFVTRQAKARFKNAKVCLLPGARGSAPSNQQQTVD
jgi:hypothetical protein